MGAYRAGHVLGCGQPFKCLLKLVIRNSTNYTTTFVANQVCLVTANHRYDAPATINRSQPFVRNNDRARLAPATPDWHSFRLASTRLSTGTSRMVYVVDLRNAYPVSARITRGKIAQALQHVSPPVLLCTRHIRRVLLCCELLAKRSRFFDPASNKQPFEQVQR